MPHTFVYQAQSPPTAYPYFLDYVEKYLKGKYGTKKVDTGGLRIQTIHAFAQGLLAAFPAEAGLVPQEFFAATFQEYVVPLVSDETGSDVPVTVW